MDLKEVSIVGGFIVLVGGHIVTFLKAKGMDEAQQKAWENEFKKLHEIDEQQWKKIDELRNWNISHEKEDLQMHTAIELKVVSLDGDIGKLDGKLDSIEKKLDRLIDDFSRRAGNN